MKHNGELSKTFNNHGMDIKPLTYVIISASLFGISPPLAKLLVNDIPPVALAGFLYLGAFAGLSLYSLVIRKTRPHSDVKATSLQRTDIPWLAGAILAGGIIGPISLMTGLTLVSGFSASLLLNLEGVATAMIAVIIFRENAGKNLWMGLICMTIAGVFLSWDPHLGRFHIAGPLLVTFAMVCWGIDNNLTRNISDKDPVQIARIKGIVAGAISLASAVVLGMKIPFSHAILLALLLGSFSYGISLVLFIKALEGLGSSRTGAFFSFAPFVGAVASLVILREWIGWIMLPAVAFMVTGVWLIVSERHSHPHFHEEVTHAHSHRHKDMHHEHRHAGSIHEPHTHKHTHPETTHIHVHWPDTHHRHDHDTPKEK